jgi:glycosyltransferase involved in cell wall biosynthesis
MKNVKKIDKEYIIKVYGFLRRQGFGGLRRKFLSKICGKKEEILLYHDWILKNEKNMNKTTDLTYKPLISIIVPVYNVSDVILTECIESVLNQTYSNWELCLVDDASTWDSVRNVLNRYENHPNIKIHYRKENGHISTATNDGISMAEGEYLAFLDCDDTLAENAAYEITKKLNKNPKYDFIYSDEDKLTEDGKCRKDPFFKPDWSPDTLMSLMYTCHLSVYRTSIAKEIGGMRTGFEGAQGYDFVLRFTEKTKQIGHIAKVLYHWRERQGSTAVGTRVKPYAMKAQKKAKEEALKRRNLEGTVEFVHEISKYPQYRVVYKDKNESKVSIIIPSKDNFDMLKKCIEKIDTVTKYRNFEIILVDNGSSDKVKKQCEKLSRQYSCRYIYKKMKFNFSRMCNMGAEIATGEYLLFLNDDIEVRGEEWLERLLGQASVPYTGAVGAKLLYPNSTLIQHDGILNLAVGPAHSLMQMDDRLGYYYNRNKIEYNFLAVTGACLMIKTSKFREMDGFDEKLGIAYNDVDLCFRLADKYFNVVRNDVVLYHYESVSRGHDLMSKEKMERLVKERNYLYQKNKRYQKYDPCYNINLADYRIDYYIKI